MRMAWAGLAVAVVVVLGWALSCSPSQPMSSEDLGAEDMSVDPLSELIGTACTGATVSDLQGSCPSGTACYPAPGGYCTIACGFSACPGKTVCVPSPKDGPLCARSCSVDSDCRESDGYFCDLGRKACVQWLVSPVLPLCPAVPMLVRNSFGPVTQLSTSAGPGGYHMEPGAGFDAAGNLTALYMARNDSFQDNSLGVSTLGAGGQLSADRTFTVSSKQVFDTWMARDRAGKLHVVYYGHDGFDTNAKIGYRSSADGMVWTAERNLLDPSDCAGAGCTDKPMVAVGPDPNNAANDIIYVVYGIASGVRVLRSLDGGTTFAKGALISGLGVYGDVEVAANGSVHVVGAGFTNTSNRLGDVANTVRYTVSGDGGQTFSALRAVEEASEPTPWYFSNPQLVFDTLQSRLHVVYAAGTPDGKWNIRLATSTDAGVTFTRITVNDDAPCANHATPTIALEVASGRLHVAWIENRGGTGHVAYAACAAGGATCGANEAISDQSFASYELVRHSPRWMGEYFSLLVDPAGTKLHAVWTQTVAEKSGVRARIFHSARGL
jgi:hypothetical protein